MADDAAVFLGDPREEAGNVHEGHDGQVEGVHGADEAGGLVGGVYVESAGHEARVVGDDAHRLAAKAGQADDDVAGPGGLDFQKVALVHQCPDDLVHVVGAARVGVDHVEQLGGGAVFGVVGLAPGRFFAGARGQVAENLTHQRQHFFVVLALQVGHAALGGMNVGPAQLLETDLFAGHRLDDLGSGDEHVAAAPAHQDEVGNRRAVDRAAGAGAENGAYLRHYP